MYATPPWYLSFLTPSDCLLLSWTTLITVKQHQLFDKVNFDMLIRYHNIVSRAKT